MAQSSKITETIVGTVADYEDSSPNELPPLVERLDPEMYHKLAASDSQLDELLEFEYLW